MGQGPNNNKRPHSGGQVNTSQMSNAHNNMNGATNTTNTSFSNQPQVNDNLMNGFQFEQNSQSNMIYSSDSGKVSLTDFELLKVVGQGNFAKVMQVK